MLCVCFPERGGCLFFIFSMKFFNGHVICQSQPIHVCVYVCKHIHICTTKHSLSLSLFFWWGVVAVSNRPTTHLLLERECYERRKTRCGSPDNRKRQPFSLFSLCLLLCIPVFRPLFMCVCVCVCGERCCLYCFFFFDSLSDHYLFLWFYGFIHSCWGLWDVSSLSLSLLMASCDAPLVFAD